VCVQSSELGPPPPSEQAIVAPPSRTQVGEPHSLVGEGVGGTQSNSGDWTDTLVVYIYSNPFTVYVI
jgi:hypothetical protein